MHRRPAGARVLLVTALWATALVGVLASPGAAATPPGLDPAFGRDGLYRLDLSEPSLDVANAAVLGSNGTIAAGSAGGRFALAGFDVTAGIFNGYYRQLLVDFGRPSEAHGILSWGDKLTAVGRAGNDFAVATLEADGDPVPWFGDQGRVRTSFGAPAAAYGVEAANIETTLAVGTVEAGRGSSVAMAQYDRFGGLDPSFGTGGKVTLDVSPGPDAAHAALLTYSVMPNQRLVVVGRAGGAVLVAGFLLDGTLDPTFGDGGRLVLDLTPGDDVAYTVRSDSSGRLVVAGSAGSAGFVARVLAGGTLDQSFGTGGVLQTSLGGTALTLKYVFVDGNTDGKIVVAGTLTRPGGNDGVIARFGPTGVPDPTFGSGGRTVADLGGPADQVNAVTGTLGTGELRLVGTDGADMASFIVRRADGSPLSPEPAVNRQTVDFSGPTGEEAGGMTVLPDGRILVAGSGTRGILLARLLPNGSPDPTFGVNGVSVTSTFANVHGVAVHEGRIYVLGYRDYYSGGSGVFRFTATGALDRSYANRGFAFADISVSVEARAMVMLPDGSVALGGGNQVVTLDAAGQIASSYLLGRSSQVVAMTAQPDGKYVVLSRNGREQVGAELRRFTAAGELDPSFHNSTWLSSVPVAADPSALARLRDGRFVVGAKVALVDEPDLVLAGFKADGSLDTAFGTNGVTRTPVRELDCVRAVTELADGRVVAVHGPHVTSPNDVTGLVRLLPDGRLDPSFGTNGVTTASGVHPATGALTAGGQILLAGRSSDPFDLVVGRALPADTGAPAPYHPVPPVRLLDTRTGLGAPAAKVGPGATLALAVTGGAVPPSGATAVVLNVTVTGPSSVSYLTAWPAGQPRPVASNLNMVPGQTVANLVAVKIGDGGKVNLFNNAGTTDVVADLAGWYGTAAGGGGARYTTATPARILDTRTGVGAEAGKVGPAGTVALQVTGRGGVPAIGVSAVVMNVTATEPTGVSYLTAWPAGSTRPLASNLNYTAGQTVPNLVMVKVGEGGKVNLYNSGGSVHLVADVAGWYGPDAGGTGALFSPAVPARILDTRAGLGGPPVKVGAGSTLGLQVTGRGGVPATGVAAVVLNVTATEATGLSYLTAWPAGEARPLASNLNYTAGQTVPNLVVVKVGEGGRVNLYNSGGTVHLIADVAGWFAAS